MISLRFCYDHDTPVPRCRKPHTEREYERESDHCDISRNFPHELSFVLKAAKRVEIRWWNEVIYDLTIICTEQYI
jgi:hypothetical protein